MDTSLTSTVTPPAPAPAPAATGFGPAPDTVRRTRTEVDPARARLEAEVRRRAREFDVIALIELLRHMGYARDEILFASHLSSATQAGLVHKVEFRERPIRQAVVTLNMGLLSPHTPLPSYFFQILDDAGYDEDALLGFVGFFDHTLLAAFLGSIYPETDTSVHRSWEKTKRDYLSLLATRSLSTMHWLFQLIFPELGVSASRGALMRRMRVAPLALGKAKLGGEGALGGSSTVPVPGIDLMLTCEEEYTDDGKPWADEIRRRLASMAFPILRENDLDLRIALTIRSQRGWARLGKGSYLGFDRIRGGAERNRVIVIHRGPIPADTRGAT